MSKTLRYEETVNVVYRRKSDSESADACRAALFEDLDALIEGRTGIWVLGPARVHELVDRDGDTWGRDKALAFNDEFDDGVLAVKVLERLFLGENAPHDEGEAVDVGFARVRLI